MGGLIEMGRVAGPYGVCGWIRIAPFSDEPEALSAFPVWRIGDTEFEVEQSRMHSGSLLAKLGGLEDRDQALALKGAVVTVPREALGDAGEGRYFWADLIGFSVVNGEGMVFGAVKSLFSNGAHDVIEIAGERSRLVPWIPAVIRHVDLAARRIEVDWGSDW